MVSVSSLYNDLITLINQNFYTKTEVDNKRSVVNITNNFKSYLINECEVSSNYLTTKTFIEIAEYLNVTLESLLEDYFDENSLSNGTYFQIYSEICEAYILGIILSDGSILILSNPEYLLLDE